MLLFSHSHTPAAWVLLTRIHACFLCHLQSQKLKANIEKLPSTCFVFAYCYRCQLFPRLILKWPSSQERLFLILKNWESLMFWLCERPKCWINQNLFHSQLPCLLFRIKKKVLCLSIQDKTCLSRVSWEPRETHAPNPQIFIPCFFALI